jgi:hypothetical protein
MNTQFIASLDLEIARLEQAVERIPEVKQLNELRRVRALYGPTNRPAGPGPTGPAQEPASLAQHLMETGRLMAAQSGRPSVGRKMAPERQRAIEIVTEILKKEILPIKTAHLWAAVETQGIALGGTDPVNSLSALLSTSGQFQAHGRSGWTLKKPAIVSLEQFESPVSAPPKTEESGNPGAGGAGAD